jgi:hypothetical protein
MFAAFESLDCKQNQCKSAVYDDTQSRIVGYRTSWDNTNRRCYRDPVVESQLWNEQYKTRFYTPADCAKPVAAAAAAAPLAPQITHPVMFAEVTKERRPLYEDC